MNLNILYAKMKQFIFLPIKKSAYITWNILCNCSVWYNKLINFTKQSAVYCLRRYHFFSYTRYFPFFMGFKGSVLISRQPEPTLPPKPNGSNLFSHPFKPHFNTLFPYISSNLFHFKLSKQISPSVTRLIHSYSLV
jgi:hypothetical protein